MHESVAISGLCHCLIIEPTTITKAKTTAKTTIEFRAGDANNKMNGRKIFGASNCNKVVNRNKSKASWKQMDNRQASIQTDRQMDRRADRRADRLADWRTDNAANAFAIGAFETKPKCVNAECSTYGDTESERGASGETGESSMLNGCHRSRRRAGQPQDPQKSGKGQHSSSSSIGSVQFRNCLSIALSCQLSLFITHTHTHRLMLLKLCSHHRI